ncbi:MAG: hypothetical protein HLUCCA04_03090 [Oceanicaulis sp. HLUCCA04]|nr:MAG: hypothetical protein HLUCCA04_03090 [Oceanicaulis sp. HLUCCA04]
MARGSRHDLHRIAARSRRVRRPHEAGWPRRALWTLWQAVASLVRPALFAALAGGAGVLVFDGMQHLDSRAAVAEEQARVSHAFSALAPDAASAASIWRSELDAAMRPHAETPPDSALAASLIAAFEDVVGRERFSSMVWADRNAGSIQEAEAILRALPVWVRDRELEAVWARQMEGAQADMPATGVLALATATARRRIERSARLYDAANQPAAAVFAGHEQAALNLAVLPGLMRADMDGALWLPSDRDGRQAYCSEGIALECALARTGSDPRAGQGARVLRAALLTGHAGEELRSALAAADAEVLHAVASEMSAVARDTANIDAIRLTALLERPQDAALLRRLSAQAGPRTLALAHFQGRDALTIINAEPPSPLVTRAARDRFILAGVLVVLAFGMVLAALVSAFSVRVSGKAGLGQRIDITMRELLLGRKT